MFGAEAAHRRFRVVDRVGGVGTAGGRSAAGCPRGVERLLALEACVEVRERVELNAVVLGPIRRSTIWQILKDAYIDPAPERTAVTWSAFLRSQAVVACDFATIDTVTLRHFYLLFLDRLGCVRHHTDEALSAAAIEIGICDRDEVTAVKTVSMSAMDHFGWQCAKSPHRLTVVVNI